MKEQIIKDIIENANPQDVDLLLWFIDIAKTQLQLNAFVNCIWKDGKRIYKPTKELIKMYNKCK